MPNQETREKEILLEEQNNKKEGPEQKKEVKGVNNYMTKIKTEEEKKNRQKDKKELFQKLKEEEKDKKMNEITKDLNVAANEVQKKIERTGNIDSDARHERGNIFVLFKPKSDAHAIQSWGIQTEIKVIDHDTISITGGRGHDLKVDINPLDGLEEVINIANTMNMVMKKAKGKVEYDDGMIQADEYLYDTDLVSLSTLNKLGISAFDFVQYINERKYADEEKQKEQEQKKQENMQLKKYQRNQESISQKKSSLKEPVEKPISSRF